jgi:hypothetical protein
MTPGPGPETNATGIFPLVHVPPNGVLPSVVVPFTQSVNVPVIFDGSGFTVTVTDLVQPLGPVPVIVPFPVLIPDTIPVAAPTEAIAGLPELHVIGDVVELKVVVAPRHTANDPVNATGCGMTVTTIVALHVVGKV